MILKKYRATRSKFLSIAVNVDGKYQRVNFHQGNKNPKEKYAWFETSDEKLIEGIDKSKYFGVLFKVENIKVIKETPKAEEPKEAEEPKVEKKIKKSKAE